MTAAFLLGDVYIRKKQGKPIIKLISAPPITSRMKWTPERTLVKAIATARKSITTPILVSMYKNARAMMKAEAV